MIHAMFHCKWASQVAYSIEIFCARSFVAFCRWWIRCRTVGPTTGWGHGLTKRRLVVDVSIISKRDAGTGIQRVVRNVIQNICGALPKGVTLELVAAQGRHGEYQVVNAPFGDLNQATIDHGTLPSPMAPLGDGDVFLALDLAPRLASSNWCKFLSWRLRGAQVWFVVYDLLPLHEPRWFPRISSLYFRRWLYTVAAVADGAIFISADVKWGFLDWSRRWMRLPVNALRLESITLGTDLGVGIARRTGGDGSFDMRSLLARTSEAGYVLVVGTIEPRKAYAEVLDAFERLWKDGDRTSLVIVGKIGWMVDDLVARIHRLQASNSPFLWFDDLNDDQLRDLYIGAVGLLMASRGEGFGLPISEALRHGKCVLARDLPVFRDLFSQGGVRLFSAGDARGLADALRSWLSDLRDGSVEKVPSQPSRSWTQTTNQLLHILGCAGSPESRA